MAKMVKKKSSKDIDYVNYAEGDALIDLMREYFTSTSEIHSGKWKAICRADMENKRLQRRKKINDRRYR